MSITFVTIDRFASEAEAQLLVIRLRDAGLHPYVANTHLQGSKGAVAFAQAYIWVQVPEEEVSDAQEIAAKKLPPLTDAESADLEAEADALALCPECQSERVEYAESGGKILGVCTACTHRWTLE